jgi:hypothetical protein
MIALPLAICLAATLRGGAPHITSIRPDTLALGSTATVTIRGRHFAHDSNWVEFGPAHIGPLSAKHHGCIINFSVPATLPSTGEAPPLRLGPSTYTVRVTTSAGSSNTVPFTLVQR